MCFSPTSVSEGSAGYAQELAVSVLTELISQSLQSSSGLISLAAPQHRSHCNVIIVQGEGHSSGASKETDQKENGKSCEL